MKIIKVGNKIPTVDGKVIKVVSGGGVENVEWHQCPQLVRDYLDNVTYNPNDYTTSQIANYASAVAVQSNTKPIGKTVDGVTYYNEVPNVKTPFSSTSEAGTLKPLDRLRWINTPQAPNVRDLGGWSCDGGTVKYGLLFRGGQPTIADRDVLVNQCGIRADLDLRSTDTHDTGQPQNDGITSSPLGDDVKYIVAPNYNWYKLYSSYAETTEAWEINLRCIFENASKGIPVYYHCSAGADRTGTLACIIEGILGVTQSDIDKDYELTCFYSGTGTDGNARRRNEVEWKGLITAINALSGSTFRDKCVNFVASLGFSAAEINAFRVAMIDGTPETVTPNISTFTVTNTLSHVATDNASVTVTQYQPYKANIAPADGYKFDSVALAMGGANIKAGCYSEEVYPTIKGKIYIPKVMGNIVLSASAIMPIPTYTNQISISTDTDGSIYNSIGYKLSTRINSSGNAVDATDSWYAGACATGFIPVKKGDIIRLKNCVINSTHAQAGSFNVSQYNASKTRLTNGGTASWLQFTEAHATSFSYWWQDMQFDDSGNVVQFQLINNDVKFIRFTALNITSSSVITVNEVIE